MKLADRTNTDSHTGNFDSPDHNDDQSDWAQSEDVDIQTACLVHRDRISPNLPHLGPGENEPSAVDCHGSDFDALSRRV